VREQLKTPEDKGKRKKELQNRKRREKERGKEKNNNEKKSDHYSSLELPQSLYPRLILISEGDESRPYPFCPY